MGGRSGGIAGGRDSGGISFHDERLGINRRRLKTVEREINGLSNEHLTVVGANGERLFDTEGDSDRHVSIPKESGYLLKNSDVTHNHPNGGVLSGKDLESALKYRAHSIRAVGPEYTFVVERESSLGRDKGIKLAEEYQKFEHSLKVQNSAERKQLNKLYDAGKISQEEYDRRWWATKDRFQEERDKWLRKNTEKYGYIYYVERSRHG